MSVFGNNDAIFDVSTDLQVPFLRAALRTRENQTSFTKLVIYTVQPLPMNAFKILTEKIYRLKSSKETSNMPACIVRHRRGTGTWHAGKLD